MNVALFGCLALYIVLKFFPLRALTVIALWMLNLKNSEFFCTLGVSIAKRLKKVNFALIEKSFQEKREKALSLTRKSVKLALDIYEWPIKPVLNSMLALFGHLTYIAKYLQQKYRDRFVKTGGEIGATSPAEDKVDAEIATKLAMDASAKVEENQLLLAEPAIGENTELIEETLMPETEQDGNGGLQPVARKLFEGTLAPDNSVSLPSLPSETSLTATCEFSSMDEYESGIESSSGDENVFNPFQSPGPGDKNRRMERVVKCCYENQRYWVISGWSAMMGGALERAAWSDAKGLFYLPKKSIKLEKGWQWISGWQVEGRDVRGSQSLEDESIDHNGTYDKNGWQYSDRFGNQFSGHQKTMDFVRRRKWVRVAQRIQEIAHPEAVSPRNKSPNNSDKPVDKTGDANGAPAPF